MEKRSQLLPTFNPDEVTLTPESLGIVVELFDAIFTSCVVAPLVVGVWRGIWGLMDLHAEFFPAGQSFSVGVILHICFTLTRSYLIDRSKGALSGHNGSFWKWLRERFVARCYTLTSTIACLLQWRGGWLLFDMTVQLFMSLLPEEINKESLVLILVMVAMIASLGTLRSLKNLLASPYFLVIDSKHPTYNYDTRFRTDSLRDTTLYILDCTFSVVVVGSLVVFVWRGTWTLLDIYLFPHNTTLSNCTSLGIGYALVAVTFGLQSPARWACARLATAPRLILADIYHLFSFFATVNLWRGIWGLLDQYFLPGHPYLSNWLSQSISIVVLILLNCSNTVLVRGVYIDAEEPAGECVVFPCHYLRIFFHKERTKKRHKAALRAAAAAAAARKSEDLTAQLAPLHPTSIIIQEKAKS